MQLRNYVQNVDSRFNPCSQSIYLSSPEKSARIPINLILEERRAKRNYQRALEIYQRQRQKGFRSLQKFDSDSFFPRYEAVKQKIAKREKLFWEYWEANKQDSIQRQLNRKESKGSMLSTNVDSKDLGSQRSLLQRSKSAKTFKSIFIEQKEEITFVQGLPKPQKSSFTSFNSQKQFSTSQEYSTPLEHDRKKPDEPKIYNQRFLEAFKI